MVIQVLSGPANLQVPTGAWSCRRDAGGFAWCGGNRATGIVCHGLAWGVQARSCCQSPKQCDSFQLGESHWQAFADIAEAIFSEAPAQQQIFVPMA
mmetsp:Transcript_13470/g.31645  ORF Transcript_13470/g.31645 Transcript_13470/m.31645 type:complete len:96 (+) Transcript_13470:3673-3960(+)